MKKTFTQRVNEEMAKLSAERAGLKQIASIGVMSSGKLLMGRRRDNGRWTIPGGHCDAGEQPLQGALRELYEEAGIKAHSLIRLGSERVTTFEGKQIVVHAFKLDTFTQTTTVRNDPDMEVHRWEWVDTFPHLPLEVLTNLHSPKNVVLRYLGLQHY